VHFSHVPKYGEPAPVWILSFQQPGVLLYPRSAGKNQSNTVLPIQIEDNDVAFVLLRIERRHFAGVKKRRCVPFDLFTDVRADFKMISRRAPATRASGCFRFFMYASTLCGSDALTDTVAFMFIKPFRVPREMPLFELRPVSATA
jgi:hypothetical protein